MPTEMAGFSICVRCTCFFKPALLKGKEVPRFTKIVDPDAISQLEAIKARMYPNP